MSERKRYIGDGVYVDVDGYAVILTTEDGICTTNRIVLEPQVVTSLELYLETLDDPPVARISDSLVASLKALYVALPDCEGDYLTDAKGNHS